MKKNQITSMLQISGQRIFTILFVSLLCNSIFPQDSINPSLDSSKVYFFYNNFEKQGPEFLSFIDTLVTGIQRYDPINRPGNYFA